MLLIFHAVKPFRQLFFYPSCQRCLIFSVIMSILLLCRIYNPTRLNIRICNAQKGLKILIPIPSGLLPKVTS